MFASFLLQPGLPTSALAERRPQAILRVCRRQDTERSNIYSDHGGSRGDENILSIRKFDSK
jgi:hypothetical protein